jgi:hypothetical protein
MVHDIAKNRVADPNPDQHGFIPFTHSDPGGKIALLIVKRDIF